MKKPEGSRIIYSLQNQTDALLASSLKGTKEEFEDFISLVHLCNIYRESRFKLSPNELAKLTQIHSCIMEQVAKFQDDFPEVIDSSITSLIACLQAETEMWQNKSFELISRNTRIQNLCELELAIFNYQSSELLPLITNSALKERYLNALEKLREQKKRLIEVDRSYIEQIVQDRQEGSLEIDDLSRILKQELQAADSEQNRIGSADYFLLHLLGTFDIPTNKNVFTDEMRHFYPTPAKIFWKIIQHLGPLDTSDVFYDFGSGTGRIPLMVRLLTPAHAKGIEYEPKYNEIGVNAIKSLNLDRVTLICEDARNADFSDGTIFYFFEPFKGKILKEVLERIKHIAMKRSIKVISYDLTDCTRGLLNCDFLTLESKDTSSFFFTNSSIET